jgi:hypothetical protein
MAPGWFSGFGRFGFPVCGAGLDFSWAFGAWGGGACPPRAATVEVITNAATAA